MYDLLFTGNQLWIFLKVFGCVAGLFAVLFVGGQVIAHWVWVWRQRLKERTIYHENEMQRLRSNID